MLGRSNYFGFFIDWFVELIGNATAYAMIIATASIFIGLSLYINGMMEDMKMRLMSIDSDSTEKPSKRLNPVQMWSIYVEEIQFHIEIIE